MKGELFKDDISISDKILLTKNPIKGEIIKYLDISYTIKKVILCENHIRLDVYIYKPQDIYYAL